MALTQHDQKIVNRLCDHYQTNSLEFSAVTLQPSNTNDEIFFNDSPDYRYYGNYLVVKDNIADNEYCIPYYFGLSFPILTTIIDMMLSGGYDLGTEIDEEFSEVEENDR